MDSLQIKKAIFSLTEITLLRKKESIIIDVDNISWIDYRKPNLLNWLFSTTIPGFMWIHLKQTVGNKKMFIVRIKYKDYVKLPAIYQTLVNQSSLFPQ
ncbi:MAG: hypothetical protein FWH03_02275 [Firmicutes bacterium]|nr:hypothetical protein [Bacillota bacterium]